MVFYTRIAVTSLELHAALWRPSARRRLPFSRSLNGINPNLHKHFFTQTITNTMTHLMVWITSGIQCSIARAVCQVPTPTLFEGLAENTFLPITAFRVITNPVVVNSLGGPSRVTFWSLALVGSTQNRGATDIKE